MGVWTPICDTVVKSACLDGWNRCCIEFSGWQRSNTNRFWRWNESQIFPVKTTSDFIPNMSYKSQMKLLATLSLVLLRDICTMILNISVYGLIGSSVQDSSIMSYEAPAVWICTPTSQWDECLWFSRSVMSTLFHFHLQQSSKVNEQFSDWF